jgi:geranylgeranyl pyrophosphate synthase
LRKGKMTLPILMLLRSAPPEERERLCELILGEDAGLITKHLRIDSPNGALRSALDAGEESVRDAQSELHSLPSNPYTDSLFQLGDALRELLDQFRV